jgi:hypothetical protein
MQYHHSTPFGNTTIFIGGGGAPVHHQHQHQHHHHPGMEPNYGNNNNVDLGTFLQAVMGQLAGGLVGVGGPPFPSYVVFRRSISRSFVSLRSVMHNMGHGGNMNPMDIDAFLTQVTTETSMRKDVVELRSFSFSIKWEKTVVQHLPPKIESIRSPQFK